MQTKIYNNIKKPKNGWLVFVSLFGIFAIGYLFIHLIIAEITGNLYAISDTSSQYRIDQLTNELINTRAQDTCDWLFKSCLKTDKAVQ